MFGIAALLVLATATSVVEPAPPGGAFVWSDCTTDTSNQILKVNMIKAGPLPLTYPGHLTLTIDAMILKPIVPGIMLHMKFEKELLGTYTKVPCVAGLGSCPIETCSILNSTSTSTDPVIVSLSTSIFKMFKDSNAHIDYCPVPVQNITITDYTIDIPDLAGSPLLNTFADGNYKVTLEFRDPGTNQQRGCVHFEGGLKALHHHFFFG